MEDANRPSWLRRVWRSRLFWLLCTLALAISANILIDQTFGRRNVSPTPTPATPSMVAVAKTPTITATATPPGARIPPYAWAPNSIFPGADGVWRLRPGIDLTDPEASKAGWGYAVTDPNRVSPSGLTTMRFQRQNGSAVVFFAGLENTQLYTLTIELGTSRCYDSTDLRAGGRFIGDIGGPSQTAPVQAYPFTIPRDVIGADGVLVLYLMNSTNVSRCSLDSAPIYQITITPQTKHRAPGPPPGALYFLRRNNVIPASC